jgi:hypothetical protein
MVLATYCHKDNCIKKFQLNLFSCIESSTFVSVLSVELTVEIGFYSQFVAVE